MSSTTFSGPVTSTNGFIGNVTGTASGAAGLIVPSAYTLATLPAAVVANQVIVVTDANTGAGTVCFGKGAAWIDIKTGLAVA